MFTEIESLIQSVRESLHRMDMAMDDYDQRLIKCRELAAEAIILLDKAEKI